MGNPRVDRSLCCLLLVAALGLAGPAMAHPLSRDAWSLRNAVKLGPDGVQAVVIMEVPADVVMAALREDFEGEATGEELDETVARAQVRRWNEGLWQDMARGLELRIDGQLAPGEWSPLRSDANGKGGEGFFVYMVGFRPKRAQSPIWKLGDEVTIELRDTIAPEEPMFLTALVATDGPWTVKASSAEAVLGDQAGAPDLDDPEAWSEDPSLRTLTVTFSRRSTDARSPRR
jgi:hypothetical protein